MSINNFLRFHEIVKIKSDTRVVNVTVRPFISDCSGNVLFTDIQIQEGDVLSGYTSHTSGMLRKSENPPRFHNGIVRSGETIIIFNLGETSAGLDCYIYPNQPMAAGAVSLSQGYGSHRATFLPAATAGDELALKASTHECLLNGETTQKRGFYQYSAAWDSKHQIKLEDGKSARVYFEYHEMLGGERF
ncbi:hypothetical protein FACS18949_12650 [Clostridia bacterium]|nr:hypothetical protein FACS18949_12650 [Clostridia bacterium]